MNAQSIDLARTDHRERQQKFASSNRPRLRQRWGARVVRWGERIAGAGASAARRPRTAGRMAMAGVA